MLIARLLLMAGTLCLTLIAADPFLGTWKRNVAQSKASSGQAVQPGTTTIEPLPDGYRITSDRISTPFILHLNGRDYKDNTKGFAETSGADTSSARRISNRVIETTFKRKGKVVGTIRREISADDRTLTTTIDGVNAKDEKVHSVTVSDRQ